MIRPLVLALTLPGLLLPAELPVRQVTLYKNGVGYFERAGSLASGEGARLDFKASEMNDVLKSLTVEDRSGGQVTAVRYDASEPLEVRLQKYPFALPGQVTLAGFLDQLKGAVIELRYGSDTVRGTIVSARAVPATDKQPAREELLLLLDTGEMRTLDLSAAASTRLVAPELQVQLRDYLAAVSQSRVKDQRSVYVDSSDARGRQLVASYLVPTPVWKSSYRLIFAPTGEPTLEGWAIVDNTSGEDWTKVNLALVSGRPVSFISRLYEPRYRQRIVAELPEDRAEAPTVYAGTMGGVMGGIVGGLPAAAPPPPPVMAAPRMPAGRMRSEAAMNQAEAREQDASSFRQDAASTLGNVAEGREAGELFEYRFGTPVTVRKGQSAMLPFLQQKLPARKLLIYTDAGSIHPRNAAEITNSSGKTLDGGPITVFDAATYAGEALVETVKTGDKRLIDYAVDLGTRVTTRFDSGDKVVRELRVSRGQLTARTATEERKTYSIHNVDAKAKTLLIEHPARPEVQLLSPKPTERTPTAYRFEVKLAAGATEKFTVTEERVESESEAISSLTPDALLVFLQNKTLSANARQQLERVAALKGQLAEASNQRQRAEAEIKTLGEDQDRIRRNIGSLSSVSGQQEQVQRYARALAEQETQIAALRDRVAQARTRETALQAELNAAIEKVSF